MKTQEYHYHCPYCKSEISKDNIVEFEIQNSKKKRAKLRINGVPGIYNFAINGLKHLEWGETYDFYCIQCKRNLRGKKYSTFIEVDLKIAEHSWLSIYFSPVLGDSKTLVFLNENIFTGDFQFPTWKKEDGYLSQSA